MSIKSYILMRAIKLRRAQRARRRRLKIPLDIIGSRKQAIAFNAVVSRLQPDQHDVEIVEDNLDSIRSLRIQGHSKPNRVILHLHGGAYFFGVDHMATIIRYFASELARTCEAQVWTIDYRLAPENPYPAAINDAFKAYLALLAKGIDPRQIFVVGESAGGGLTLALLMKLRDEGKPLPKAAVVISPWTDLALTGESRWERENIDPMLSSQGEAAAVSLIVSPESVKDPYISPFYGTFEGLPPLMVLVGGREVLFDDSVRIAEKAKQAGVEVILDINEEMFHTYPVFGGVLKEGKAAIYRIAAFVRKNSI